jgi:hypothetical protein
MVMVWDELTRNVKMPRQISGVEHVAQLRNYLGGLNNRQSVLNRDDASKLLGLVVGALAVLDECRKDIRSGGIDALARSDYRELARVIEEIC